MQWSENVSSARLLAMKLQVINPESWEKVNDELKSYLEIADDSFFKVYPSFYQGLYETCQGTSQFMSHKKSIAMVMGLSSFSTALLPAYYRDLYEVQLIDVAQLESVEAVDSWIENLKKDTVFVVLATEHAITGELFGFASLMEKKLSEKRIISISLTQDPKLITEAIPSYALRVLGLDSGWAVVRCGSRYRAPSILSTSLEWPLNLGKQLGEEITSLLANPVSSANVSAFENSFQDRENLYPLLKSDSSRSSDRTILISKKVHAQALADLILKKLNMDDQTDMAFSLSGCRWGEDSLFSDWWKDLENSKIKPSEVLILDSHLITHADIAELIKECYKELLAEQVWS